MKSARIRDLHMSSPSRSTLLIALLSLSACPVGPNPLEPIGTLTSETDTSSGDDSTAGETLIALTSGDFTTSSTSDPTGGDTESTSGLVSLCGNGELDAGEECDGDDLCFNCIRDRLVFVTGYEARFTGSAVGSVAQADETCDHMARKAGLDGPSGDRHFRAWISDETSSPLTRFSPAPGRYARPDGVVVASDWNQVLTGLTNAPQMNALGEDEYDLEVWTATLPNGTWEGSGSCNGWTSESAVAAWGTADKVDSAWTVTSVSDCRAARALYCVEQPEEVVCHQNACWTNADCDFGNECYPAVEGLGTKTCSLPCNTDEACQNDCGSNPAPTATCAPNGYCKVVLCEPGDACDCQPWLNGFHACFGPTS